MNPIALVHPTNTYRRLRSSSISIHCSAAAISASSRVCSTFELHDALLLLFLGHRCGS
jgi:hypothetical protein